MTNIAELSDLLVEWAVATVPDLLGAYDHAPERKTQPLPDIGVEVATTAIVTDADPRFPHLNIQQFILKVYTFNLHLMVNPDPPETAAEQLSGFADALMDAVINDLTLGMRLAPFYGTASPAVSASFDPPFIRFDDGTEGRHCVVTINIGEPKSLE
jgi:hypothetical protein